MSFYIRWETSAIENCVGFWTSTNSIIFQIIVQNNQKIGIWYIYIYMCLQRIYAPFQGTIFMCFCALTPQKFVVKIFPGEGDTQTLSTRYFSRVLWLAPSSDAWIFRGFFQVKIVVKIFFPPPKSHEPWNQKTRVVWGLYREFKLYYIVIWGL